MAKPRGERCPLCKEGFLRIRHSKMNKDKEYRWLYKECTSCQQHLNYYEMHEDRAKELLRYEKAYWKIKGIVDKHY